MSSFKVKGGLRQTLEYSLDRVSKTSEGVYLASIMSGSEHHRRKYLNITAEVISCPLGPFDGGCELGETCATRYPSTWYPGSGKSNGHTDEKSSERKTETIQLYHPCKIVTDENPFCITDENGEQGKGYKSSVQ